MLSRMRDKPIDYGRKRNFTVICFSESGFGLQLLSSRPPMASENSSPNSPSLQLSSGSGVQATMATLQATIDQINRQVEPFENEDEMKFQVG